MVALRTILSGAAQAGALFVAFGSIFFWMFAWNADLPALWRFRGDVATTQGTVLECRDTGIREGKRGSSRRIWAWDYEFRVDDRVLHATSWGAAKTAKAGQQVTIEYRRDDPTISRVQGLRNAPFNPVAAVAAIFPVVGAFVFLGSVAMGLRSVRLLRDGVSGRATLVKKDRTNMSVNHRRVWKLTFRFTDDSGTERTFSTRTNMPEPVTDEREEPILYDPMRPERAVLVDGIAGVRFDESGEIEPGSVLALAYLILPSVAVAVNVALSQHPFFA